MSLTNIEFRVQPNQLFEESTHMLTLVTKMRDQMEVTAQIMSATETYWRGDGAEMHRNLFFSQRENLENSIRRIELRAKDLAEISENYLTEEYRNQMVSDALPSDAIV